MSSVFAQRRQKLLSLKALRGSSPAPAQTEETCPACSRAVPRRELVANRYVCPLCGHHYPVGAYYRKYFGTCSKRSKIRYCHIFYKSVKTLQL